MVSFTNYEDEVKSDLYLFQTALEVCPSLFPSFFMKVSQSGSEDRSSYSFIVFGALGGLVQLSPRCCAFPTFGDVYTP